MKIRTGFVSNSSSSSFVLIGCSLDEDISQEEILTKGFNIGIPYFKEEWEKEDWVCDNFEDLDYVFLSEYQDPPLFGKIIAKGDASNNDLGTKCLDIAKIESIVKDVENIMKNIGTSQTVKLHTGTMAT